MFCGRKLTQRNSKMVGIVECVEQILVEWVDVLQARKALEDKAEFFRKSLLSELDLSHIEVANTADLKVFVDNLLSFL